MSKVNLSSPWVTFYREVDALFAEDQEVTVVFDEDECELKLYVENAAKADALTQLLPSERVFGNVTVKVTVIPANEKSPSKIQLFRTAFEGNNALSYTETVEGVFTNPISYVVFENKVVQYFNDDLGDAHGICSTLYQNIADDLFEDCEGIYFCTDLPK